MGFFDAQPRTHVTRDYSLLNGRRASEFQHLSLLNHHLPPSRFSLKHTCPLLSTNRPGIFCGVHRTILSTIYSDVRLKESCCSQGRCAKEDPSCSPNPSELDRYDKGKGGPLTPQQYCPCSLLPQLRVQRPCWLFFATVLKGVGRRVWPPPRHLPRHFRSRLVPLSGLTPYASDNLRLVIVREC